MIFTILSWFSLIAIILSGIFNIKDMITGKDVNQRLCSLSTTIICGIITYVLYMFMFIL